MSEQETPRRPEDSQFTCLWKGVQPTKEELEDILCEHKTWFYQSYIHAKQQGRVPPPVPHDLSGVVLDEKLSEEMVSVDLHKADLRCINLSGARLGYANLRKAKLGGANLSGAKLDNADLTEADLEGTEIYGFCIKAADLSSADLTRAEMNDCKLNNVNLHNTKLCSASLSRARLIGANLSGANLCYANLDDTELSDADLRGADLQSANLSGANVFRVKYDLKKTRFLGCRVATCYGSQRFKRDAQDGDFLEEMQLTRKGKVLYRLWWLTCDCGRSFLLWAFWSLILAAGFAAAFHFLLGPDAFDVHRVTMNGVEHGLPKNFWTMLYYSVVTFTTLGFGDVVPLTPAAAWWVMAEVVVGYIMLGGLISILATKLARRS